jgi:hypothetical protein
MGFWALCDGLNARRTTIGPGPDKVKRRERCTTLVAGRVTPATGPFCRATSPTLKFGHLTQARIATETQGHPPRRQRRHSSQPGVKPQEPVPPKRLKERQRRDSFTVEPISSIGPEHPFSREEGGIVSMRSARRQVAAANSQVGRSNPSNRIVLTQNTCGTPSSMIRTWCNAPSSCAICFNHSGGASSSSKDNLNVP